MAEIEERIANLWREYEPRIAEAAKRDGTHRHSFFVELNEERIGDFPALPLTIERWLLLVETDSIVGESPPDLRSALSFLWIVSPDFTPDPRFGRKFIRKHRKTNLFRILPQIEEYLARQFLYSTTSKEKGKGTKGTTDDKEWISTVIDVFASEYGWTTKEILSRPLPQVFLLFQRIRGRLSGTEVTFSSESDAIRAEFMNRANAMRSAL